MGVGLAHSVMTPGLHLGEGVNWEQLEKTALALFISPVIGFICAGALLLLLKRTVKQPELYAAPEGEQPPPGWVRGLLVLTCTGVSWAHGSNDGQKGQGLLVLILIGVLPATYALKMDSKPEEVQKIAASAQQSFETLCKKDNNAVLPTKEANDTLLYFVRSDGKFTDQTYAAVAAKLKSVYDRFHDENNLNDLDAGARRDVRTDLYLASTALDKLVKLKKLDGADKDSAEGFSKLATDLTKYIPLWVKIAVACALGFGTMVGWKRIVVTVGEKIGKSHLTYGQGASAETVAMVTIKAADWYGLPVSTTHILSSGVAGTMAANRAGLQKETLRNILLAWVLTLPVCMLLGAGLFAFGLYLVFNVLGLH